jgi:hypothetical protein
VKDLLHAFMSMHCLFTTNGNYCRLQTADRRSAAQTTGKINAFFPDKMVESLDQTAQQLSSEETSLIYEQKTSVSNRGRKPHYSESEPNPEPLIIERIRL